MGVYQNFGFLLPKHSVLKSLPKLPIIQVKFRWNPRKIRVSLNITEVSFLIKFINLIRNFVIYIGIFQKLGNEWWATYHIRFTFFRSKQLAAWSVHTRKKSGIPPADVDFGKWKQWLSEFISHRSETHFHSSKFVNFHKK
jgi:hypothetical protein